jgi:Domain of unknown function DUF29
MSDYGSDPVIWSVRQADLLRRLAAGEQVNVQVDWENIAEEIESLGKSQRVSLASHVLRVLEHLMKLEASIATATRRGWRETVRRARVEIAELLEDSPSLRSTVGAVIARQFPAVREIVAETLADHGLTMVRARAFRWTITTTIPMRSLVRDFQPNRGRLARVHTRSLCGFTSGAS